MRIVFVIPLALLLASSAARAQSIEFGAGLDVPLAPPSFTYETRYVPPLAFSTDATGEAGQVLNLRPSRRPRIWATVAWFPASRVGVEVRVARRSSPLAGTSGPHELTLTYISHQPPDHLPREHTLTSSDPQPDPAGTLRELSFDVTAVGRFGDPDRLQARIAGGVSFVGIDADVQPVRFTRFQLGGHSVLFSDAYEVDLGFDRAWTIGAVAGVEVQRALSANLAVVAGGRFVMPRTADAPARVIGVRGGLSTPETSEIEAQFRPGPLRVRPWSADIVFGLRVRL